MPLPMQITQGMQNLLQNRSNALLRQPIRVQTTHNRLKRPARHERHHDPKPALCHKRTMGPQNIRVRQKRHRFGLPTNSVEVGSRLVEVDRFDGDQGGVHRNADCFVDYGAHSPADFVEDSVRAFVEWVVGSFGFLFWLSHEGEAVGFGWWVWGICWVLKWVFWRVMKIVRFLWGNFLFSFFLEINWRKASERKQSR